MKHCAQSFCKKCLISLFTWNGLLAVYILQARGNYTKVNLFKSKHRELHHNRVSCADFQLIGNN